MTKKKITRKEFISKTGKCAGGLVCTPMVLSIFQSCTGPTGPNVDICDSEYSATCPEHNSVFNEKGEVLSGPASTPLDRYDVSLSDDKSKIISYVNSFKKENYKIKKNNFNASLYNKRLNRCHKELEKVSIKYNINQTLIQAVSSSVVKTVTNISKGGLAIALLKMYLKMKCEFGMKIHISRRLTPEELLFGESFGSALVIVGEKELMEFQRICMVHGIPCSTIGRLQPKKEITVNDLLKIRENFLNTL